MEQFEARGLSRDCGKEERDDSYTFPFRVTGIEMEFSSLP